MRYWSMFSMLLLISGCEIIWDESKIVKNTNAPFPECANNAVNEHYDLTLKESQNNYVFGFTPFGNFHITREDSNDVHVIFGGGGSFEPPKELSDDINVLLEKLTSSVQKHCVGIESID